MRTSRIRVALLVVSVLAAAASLSRCSSPAEPGDDAPDAGADLRVGASCAIDAGPFAAQTCHFGRYELVGDVLVCRHPFPTYAMGVLQYKERCDGIDNDCDGLVDDIDDPVELSWDNNCGSCGNVCDGGSHCHKSGTTYTCAEQACGNSVDDDRDGLADCKDPDCRYAACGPSFDAGSQTCGSVSSGVFACIAEDICDNGVDDDGDGKVDCAEPYCSGKWCGPGRRCRSNGCVIAELNCEDGIDNDSDGLADCGDRLDCEGESCAGGAGSCSQGSCL